MILLLTLFLAQVQAPLNHVDGDFVLKLIATLTSLVGAAGGAAAYKMHGALKRERADRATGSGHGTGVSSNGKPATPGSATLRIRLQEEFVTRTEFNTGMKEIHEAIQTASTRMVTVQMQDTVNLHKQIENLSQRLTSNSNLLYEIRGNLKPKGQV